MIGKLNHVSAILRERNVSREDIVKGWSLNVFLWCFRSNRQEVEVFNFHADREVPIFEDEKIAQSPGQVRVDGKILLTISLPGQRQLIGCCFGSALAALLTANIVLIEKSDKSMNCIIGNTVVLSLKWSNPNQQLFCLRIVIHALEGRSKFTK